MHQRVVFSGFMMVVCSAFLAPSYGATPIDLQNASFGDVAQSFQLILPQQDVAHLKMGKQSLHNFLWVRSFHKDDRGVYHTRLEQRYAGLRVIGGDAVFHTNHPVALGAGFAQSYQSITMNGVLYEGLKDELGAVPSSLLKNQAAALAHFLLPYQGIMVKSSAIVPVVYIDRANHPHYAYKINSYLIYPHKMPEKPTAIIDAFTFEPYVEWNDIQTIKTSVKAKGYGGNLKTGKVIYGGNAPLLTISRDKLNNCYMENKDVRVVDMKHLEDYSNTPMSFFCPILNGIPGMKGIWTGLHADGYDLINGAFSPSNDALYFGSVIKRLYSQWYHLDVLETIEGNPMQLLMRVHYGSDYDNAYWDGEGMTFGDGSDVLYPLVSLGVIAHEVSHGFTQQHADLNYYGQSGGMNESFSDMAAKAAEYFLLKQPDWSMGSDIIKPESGYVALRFMDIPSRDGASIDNADEYQEDMDVHLSSGVYNRFFYLLATTKNWNVKKAFDIMVKANRDYWVPSTDYLSGACGVLRAAMDLNYSRADVEKAFDAVHISVALCA